MARSTVQILGMRPSESPGWPNWTNCPDFLDPSNSVLLDRRNHLHSAHLRHIGPTRAERGIWPILESQMPGKSLARYRSKVRFLKEIFAYPHVLYISKEYCLFEKVRDVAQSTSEISGD